MIQPSRRIVLAGMAATLAMPARAAAGGARAALDRAAVLAGSDPAGALRLLDGITGTTTGERLDLLAARTGLRIDAAIAATAPTHRPGRSPYRVTLAAGAWKDGTDAAAIDADTAALVQDAAAGVILPRPMLERLVAAIEAKRDPRLARQAMLLRSLLPQAPARPGLAHLPNGRDWYALILRRQTGDGVTPAAAERRLEQERRRLTTRATALFAAVGDPRGELGERYARLWQDTRFLYPDDQAGRDRAVADMNRTLAAIRPHLADAFGSLPPAVLDVATRRLTAADEAAGKNGYRALPAPGRPGAYVVDLRTIRRRPSWSLPSVVAHELLPGHMIQLPLEATADPHPLRLEYAGSFPEGWATWAEVLAARRGWLGADPRVMLGHIHWLLFRIERGLADIALHWRGRDAAAVRADMTRRMGEPAYFAPFDVEMDRIPVEPASRAADAIHWLAIQDAAGSSTGAALRRFHARLLDYGRVRTDMLETPT